MSVVMEKRPKSKGFGGWLGRQLGYVKQAIKTPVSGQKIIRQQKVEEKPLPGNPNVTLRRTVTDEMIVKQPPTK